jgi:hypothetical protein
MKMPSSIVPALLATLVVGGCYAPQPTTLYRSGNYPDGHWYELPATEGRVKSLPEALQNALEQQRQEVAAERAKGGGVSAATEQRIAELDEACNGAYVVSFTSVTSNPTPELNGQFESWDDRRRNDAMVNNQNFRMMADEWSRFWLMERPGGSAYDLVNTTGRD